MHRRTNYTVTEALGLIGGSLIELQFWGTSIPAKFSPAAINLQARQLLGHYIDLEVGEVPAPLVHSLIAQITW
jgi:hypothetical protein